MLCVAVGNWCCKITVLCNVRDFSLLPDGRAAHCTIQWEHCCCGHCNGAGYQQNQAHRVPGSACMQLPLMWAGFYRWVESSVQPLAFNILQVGAHYLHARKMSGGNSSLLPKSRIGFPCSASPSLVPGFPVTRLANTGHPICELSKQDTASVGATLWVEIIQLFWKWWCV